MTRGVSKHRSWQMAQVRGKHTQPELHVRRMLWASGYRYRLHARHLPGTPDIVFKGRRKAILINGCFWHRHQGCRLATLPKTRTEFWNSKFEANKARDRRNLRAMRKLGWTVATVWQCELSNENRLFQRLKRFLDS
jgi:DNA mismatch endonuclease (patch repair protein)